jgi:hypothetical protein
MKKISYIISPSYRISAHIDNQPYVVNPDHPRYKDIVAAIQQDDADTFKKLADINSAIADYTIGLVSVIHGIVKFKDRVVQTYTAQRILDAMKLGLPFEPVIRFLENVMLNPSKRAVDELDHWMSHNDIPITDDGFWLGYKRLHFTGTQAWVYPDFHEEVPEAVLNNYGGDEEAMKRDGYHKVDVYVDCHSKTIRQWVGKVVEVERNTVDDNFGIDCSEGLHVGSQSYVKSYSSEESLTTVKVNPADVVSVPRGEVNKCRVCRYFIIEINKAFFEKPIVNATGGEVDQSRKTVKVYIRGGVSDEIQSRIDELNTFTNSKVDRADDIDLNSNDNMLVYENMLAVEANNFATAVRDLNDDNIRDVVVVDYNEAASEAYEAENSDDEDEEDEEDDDDRDVLKVVFVGQPTTEQEEKFTKAIYDATNYSIDLDSTDDEWFEESEQGGDRIYTIKNDSYDDLDDARKAVEDYRFVRSAVINPEKPAKHKFVTNTDQYPISFDVVDTNDNLLSSHSVRNETEEDSILTTARSTYGEIKQVNRLDARQK